MACAAYDRTQPLIDGRVKPEGISLTYVPMMMPESAFRMLHFGEFGASEMSLSYYTRSVTWDERPFIAIPVFPSRMFRQSCIYVHAGSGIEAPADLVGRTVGCPEYQMTAAVWIKGILAEHFDLPVDSVRYVTGGLEQPGRREPAFELTRPIEVRQIPDDRTLSSMLETGEIDALYTAHTPSCFTQGSPAVRRLFKDHQQVEFEYFEMTRIFPIMHTVVIRSDVYEQHRWVARSLTKAFEEAKRIAHAELFETTALKVMLPWLTANAEQARDVIGDDFWSYGLEPNRHVLDTFVRYSFEQGLLPRIVDTDELFARETLEESRT
jgi:4,5-dihydroxyphthalate decarboxylase